MQKITPHLWFDKEAKKAAELYTSIFPNSKITHISTLSDVPTESGNTDIVSFELYGQPFMAISAGPVFKINPSVSFHVKCDTVEEVEMLWEKLSKDGTVLMDLGEYPFSKKYGWLNDKYGISWQIMYAGNQEVKQRITPVLLFVGKVAGRGEEAINFYTSTFAAKSENSKVNMTMHYDKDESPEKEGSLKYGYFVLNGMEFGAMDSEREHKFAFNEAVSFIIPCDSQEEIDYLWEKLSADPNAEQCGWLKDKYGLSWQITPVEMNEMMEKGTPEQAARVTQAFLQMKKFDIAKLREAFDGK